MVMVVRDHLSLGRTNQFRQPAFCREETRLRFFQACSRSGFRQAVSEAAMRDHNILMYRRYLVLMGVKASVEMLLGDVEEELSCIPDMLLTPGGKLYYQGVQSIDCMQVPGWGIK